MQQTEIFAGQAVLLIKGAAPRNIKQNKLGTQNNKIGYNIKNKSYPGKRIAANKFLLDNSNAHESTQL